MFFENVNLITVVIAGIFSMGLGFLWYSPAMFGSRWMKEMNHTPEELDALKKKNGPKGMTKMYVVGFILALTTAYVISGLLNSTIVVGFSGLFCMAFSMWVAFSMPVALNSVLYGKDSIMLFVINSGYQLAIITLVTFFIGIFG